MTEKEFERDLQAFKSYAAKHNVNQQQSGWEHARLLIYLCEERLAQCKQGEEEDHDVVSTGEVIPNTRDLWEVVCPAGVTSLAVGDVVRLHSYTSAGIHHFFVRQSDYSTHPTKKDKTAPYVKLRKIENPENKSV